MSEVCDPRVDPRKLQRDGTMQSERLPRALDPATVPVHGQSMAEALLYVRDFAAHLRYFHKDNLDGSDLDWRPFFERDETVVLALLATHDVDAYRRAFSRCFRALEDVAAPPTPEQARALLGAIFALTGTLLQRLEELRSLLPAQSELRGTLTNGIRTRLAGPLRRFLAWHRADQERPPVGPALLQAELVWPAALAEEELRVFGAPPAAFADLVADFDERAAADTLAPAWLGAQSWEQLRDTAADGRVYGDPARSPLDLALSCVRHAHFVRAYEPLLRVQARVVSDARGALASALDIGGEHSPHFALLLAFLKAFEHARGEINALSGKHLDHYYRDVLGLREQPAQAPRAHVLVELAKSASSHALEAGTAFKAGKDASKRAIVFESEQQLVANRTAVASVLQLVRDEDTQSLRVGSERLEADAPWHPFEATEQPAAVGFAVASHYLHLAEGERTLRLDVRAPGAPGATQLLPEQFVCRLTGAEGWIEVQPRLPDDLQGGGALALELELDGGQPGILGHDPKLHGTAYATQLPVLEVLLRPVEGSLGTFELLEQWAPSSIDLMVKVQGLRNLWLSTDLGPVDASKPFQPFGPAPRVGSALTLGCPEAFRKRGLSDVRLHAHWRAQGKGDSTLKLEVLRQGSWVDLEQTSQVFASTSDEVQLTELLRAEPRPNAEDDPELSFVTPYGLRATGGYVRLVLQQSLGHENYASAVAEYVLKSVQGEDAQAKSSRALLDTQDPYAQPEGAQVVEGADSGQVTNQIIDLDLNYALGLEISKFWSQNDTGLPPEPFTPELTSIELDYEAQQSIALDAAGSAALYHVTPLGVSEHHAARLEGLEDSSVSLVPRLRHRNPQATGSELVPHQGELYVGLSGLSAPQNVSLLFQVEEGSADPLTSKTGTLLHLSYLRDGHWVPFAADQVDDRTSELLRSGLLTLSVPADASEGDPCLPGPYRWLRLALSGQTGAVCRLRAIHAQGVRLRFRDQDNDLSFLEDALPAESVGKLVAPVAAVKSVLQPYPSFGGRPAESPAAFRTRVSERLRHKGRGSALWDIERLVLGRFPDIHRVKCLNHTRGLPAEGESEGALGLHELAPGHVTVVAVPAVSEASPVDPLTPYVSLDVLEQARAYLEQRMSCFAKLSVRNPHYERLRTSFRVRLLPGVDESYHVALLKESLARFLAPWAYELGARPSFGGRVRVSSLIHFVEQQSYVDYVTDFRLLRVEGDGLPDVDVGAAAEGQTACSVLTSVPSAEHDVQTLSTAAGSHPSSTPGCCS